MQRLDCFSRRATICNFTLFHDSINETSRAAGLLAGRLPILHRREEKIAESREEVSKAWRGNFFFFHLQPNKSSPGSNISEKFPPQWWRSLSVKVSQCGEALPAFEKLPIRVSLLGDRCFRENRRNVCRFSKTFSNRSTGKVCSCSREK